jgi:hypothetical protein
MIQIYIKRIEVINYVSGPRVHTIFDVVFLNKLVSGVNNRLWGGIVFYGETAPVCLSVDFWVIREVAVVHLFRHGSRAVDLLAARIISLNLLFNEIKMKIVCAKCKVTKEEAEFRRNSKTSTGREASCKSCRNTKKTSGGVTGSTGTSKKLKKPVVKFDRGMFSEEKWSEIASKGRIFKCWMCNKTSDRGAGEDCDCKVTRREAAGFYKELACICCDDTYELHEGPAGTVYCDVCLHKITPNLDAWTNLVKCTSCCKRRPQYAYWAGDDICQVCHDHAKRGISTYQQYVDGKYVIEGPTGAIEKVHQILTGELANKLIALECPAHLRGVENSRRSEVGPTGASTTNDIVPIAFTEATS